jgi:sulfoxide reductase heme-binding subunit YedZ
MVSTFPVYIIAAAFACVFLLIAALVSNAIKFEGGANPKDPGKRKMWFWIIGIIATLFNLLFGLFTYYYPENNTYAKSQLITAIGIGTGICFVLYLLLGFVLSLSIKNGKINNWFHYKK